MSGNPVYQALGKQLKFSSAIWTKIDLNPVLRKCNQNSSQESLKQTLALLFAGQSENIDPIIRPSGELHIPRLDALDVYPFYESI